MIHYWETLPGPQWFSGTRIYAEQIRRAKDGAVFVELGAWKGRSAAFMGVEIANSNKRIQFYSIDHWSGSAEEKDHRADVDFIQSRLFEVFQNNIKPVQDYVKIIRSDSSRAAQHFQDGEVDFLYLDANHTFDGVTADLEHWWPKVSIGGVIAGDDWCFVDEKTNELSVRKAVTEFFLRRGLAIFVEPGEPNPEWKQWIVTKNSI